MKDFWAYFLDTLCWVLLAGAGLFIIPNIFPSPFASVQKQYEMLKAAGIVVGVTWLSLSMIVLFNAALSRTRRLLIFVSSMALAIGGEFLLFLFDALESTTMFIPPLIAFSAFTLLWRNSKSKAAPAARVVKPV